MADRTNRPMDRGGILRPNRASIWAMVSCALAFCYSLAQEPHLHKAKPQSEAASQTGRQTFESTCASCHGLDGKGGERGPDIATRREVVRLSDQQILKILRTGIPQGGMPAFAALGPATLSATMNHLRLLQGKGAPVSLPGNAEKGKQLFAGKAGCSECHAIQGSGGFLGPDLTTYGASRSVDEIRGVILSSEKRPSPRKALATATTRDGQTVSGVVRNEDNFSVQLQSPDGTFHFLTKSDLDRLTFASKPLMPGDYNTKLSTTELDQLVSYLLNIAHLQDQGALAIGAKKKAAEEE